MPVKPMPENLLLDIIFDHFGTRSEFLDWKETVIQQVDELYKTKEKYWALSQRMEESIERRNNGSRKAKAYKC